MIFMQQKFFVTILLPTNSGNPGIKLRLTRKGANYVKDIAVKVCVCVYAYYMGTDGCMDVYAACILIAKTIRNYILYFTGN